MSQSVEQAPTVVAVFSNAEVRELLVRDDHDYILAREIEEERVALKEARL